MDKNAIKKFAVWARTELIARVSLKGVEYRLVIAQLLLIWNSGLPMLPPESV